MSDILLQAIIEKLDQQDKSIQSLAAKIGAMPDHKKDFEAMQEQLATTKTEIKKIPEQISIPLNEITGLKGEAIKLRAQLKEPLMEKVKHVHYASKPLLLSIVLVMVIVGQSVWTWKMYEARDEDVIENQKRSIYQSMDIDDAKPKSYDHHKTATKSPKQPIKMGNKTYDSLK